MNINGVEINFNITNPKHAGAMDAALKNMEKKEDKIKTDFETKKVGYVSFLEGLIDMIRTFFMEATGEDVLADCESYEEAQAAYFAFLDEINKAKERIVSPYSTSRVR